MSNGRQDERDMELMRLYDGELDEGPAVEVGRRLDGDRALRDKLATMALVGELIREQVESDVRADGIADQVMGRVDSLELEADSEPTRQPPGPASASEDAVGARVGPLVGTDTGDSVRPANDNVRVLYGLAGLAAAAAAALFYWGQTAPTEVASQAETAAPASPEAVADATREPKPAPETLAAPGDDESSPAVEIAAVDFGSQTGSVFYISGGNSSSAPTAVLWVTDQGD
jgi:hypothetical protein